jgi:hypothetical protein
MKKAEQTKSTRNTKNTYKTSSGELVPGVTTILGLRAKPALVGWAFNIGKQHPDLPTVHAYVDDLARIGSCAHLLLDSHLKDKDAELGDFTPNEVTVARNSVARYFDWAKGKDIEVLEADGEVVSDDYRFGGKFDVYARIDGKHTVLDFKTGSGLYLENEMQVAAYAELLREKGKVVDQLILLRIGRTATEGFEERVITEWGNQWLAFLALRQLYDIELSIKKGEPWLPRLAATAQPERARRRQQ